MKKLILSILILLVFSGCDNNQKEEPMKTKAIVWDFDGTIADTFSIAIDCINKLADEYCYKPIQNLDLLRDKSMDAIIKQDLGLWFYQLPSYAKKAKDIVLKQIHKVSVFNGITRVLSELSKDYLIAIISSNSKENILHVLERNNVKNINEICSDSSIFGKHTVIKHFLSKHNLKPQEIIYVGDEIRDIQACKKIGVKIIAVSWGYNSKKSLDLEKPDYLVNEPQEIVGVLNEYQKQFKV